MFIIIIRRTEKMLANDMIAGRALMFEGYFLVLIILRCMNMDIPLQYRKWYSFLARSAFEVIRHVRRHFISLRPALWIFRFHTFLTHLCVRVSVFLCVCVCVSMNQSIYCTTNRKQIGNRVCIYGSMQEILLDLVGLPAKKVALQAAAAAMPGTAGILDTG